MAGSKYPNIDASGFHRGEYVGYGGGTWRISKHGKGSTAWIAVQLHGGGGRFTAPSLAKISERLALKAQSNPTKRKSVSRRKTKRTKARKNPSKKKSNWNAQIAYAERHLSGGGSAGRRSGFYIIEGLVRDTPHDRKFSYWYFNGRGFCRDRKESMPYPNKFAAEGRMRQLQNQLPSKVLQIRAIAL